MANKKLTPLEILYREFKNAKTDATRNEAWRKFEVKRGEMYPPRSDRKSAMLRDSAAVAAKYPTKVLGGENHRYYEPGRRIRMDVDETAKRSPEVFVDPESGERYVRAFHYTQPENIDNILKTGLAARIGPDSRNFQNRAGVWASFGNANPMPYDYVNRASIGEKGYAMEPLEIRIPEEEWKAMPMDHTGETVNDQVMVFRPSKAKPYGTVDVAGEKAPVVIPPEYIFRYEFPKDWETEVAGGKSLWGYTPNKRMAPVTDRGFVKSIPENILDDAKSVLGENATNNQISQWAVDNRQKELKDYFLSNDYPNLYGSLSRVNFKEQKQPSSRTKSGNYEDGIIASNMKKSAQRQWFEGTDFKNPYEFAVGTENPPKPSEGFIGKAYSDHKVFPTYEAEPTRTKEFLINTFGDKYPISRFGNTNNEYIYPKEGFVLPKNNYGQDRYSVYDYFDLAGVRDIGKGKTYERSEDEVRRAFGGHVPKYNRDDIRKFDIEFRNDLFRKGGYKEKIDDVYKSRRERFSKDDAGKVKTILDQFQIDLRSPEIMKQRREVVLGKNDRHRYYPERTEFFPEEPQNVAKSQAWYKAIKTDEFSDAMSKEVEKYLEQHPELDFDKDYDKAYKIVRDQVGEQVAQPIVDKFYPEELQKVRQQLVEDWKNQFTQDSLNRVYGHELGHKLGKYRASRGKPVNPKQL